MKNWIEIILVISIAVALVAAGLVVREYMAAVKQAYDPATRYEQALSSLTMVQGGKQIHVVGIPHRIERHVSRCERDPECEVISHD